MLLGKSPEGLGKGIEMSIGHYASDKDYESKEAFLSCYLYPEDIMSFRISLVDFTTVGSVWGIYISPHRKPDGHPEIWTGDTSFKKCDTREEAYSYICKLSAFLDSIEYEYIIEPRKYRRAYTDEYRALYAR